MDRFDAAVMRWDVARWLRSRTTDLDFTDSGQVHTVCPGTNCGGMKKRLYVNLRSKLWVCHRCGRKGNAISLVQFFMRNSTVEAMTVILKAAPPSRVEDEGREARLIEREVSTASVEMHPNYHRLTMPETDKSAPYWDYVTDRGLTATLVMNYKLGYIRRGLAENNFVERNRLVIPIYMNERLAGYTARSLSSKVTMKYWVPTWCHTGKLLFNLDAVVGREEVILVEGQFDALRLPDQAVCTFGKKISKQQIDLLVDADVRRIVLCYDADADAAGVQFANRLPEYMEVRKATLPPGTDPGDANMLDLIQAIRDAEPVDAMMHAVAM